MDRSRTHEPSSRRALDGPELPSDSLAAYLHEISRVPLLTAEEERRLGEMIRQAGLALHRLEKGGLPARQEELLWRLVMEGRQAAQRMIEANLRLVVSVAKKYGRRSIPLSDLIQEGNLGLLKAVAKYDHRMGFRFSTYATCWIRQAIMRVVAESSHAIRLPVYMAESLYTLQTARRRLEQELGRQPMVDELALETDLLSEDERRVVRVALLAGQPMPDELATRLAKARARVQLILDNTLDPLSLESPVGDDEHTSLGEMLANQQAVSPDDETFARMLHESLDKTLHSLSPREQMVLRCRFGLDGNDILTLDELGRQLGVTRERVRQIEKRALHKLRTSKHCAALTNYLS